MMSQWPTALPPLAGSALLKASPEDFVVEELLGFEPEGSGEHVFLQLRKRELTTAALVQRLERLAGVPARDIGYCGLKDKRAVTTQWFSVGLAGKPAPDWSLLEEDGHVQVMQCERHRRKLRRGVHRGNRFDITLRQVTASREALAERLAAIGDMGVPNYFGEQRFGLEGGTLSQAITETTRRRRLTRTKRNLYYSALRAFLFNEMLSQRVADGSWNQIQVGDLCMFQGSRSQFFCEALDTSVTQRCRELDVHPGLPLWGSGPPDEWQKPSLVTDIQEKHRSVCDYLESAGLSFAWRSTRLVADDFSWQFCDDDALKMQFSLGPGGYATTLLKTLIPFATA